jgi:dihydroflavonol-4-reductase
MRGSDMDGPSGSSILVTGATGFTGSHLVRALAADGQRVRAVVRNAEQARLKLPASVELLEGDVADGEVVNRAVRGIDTIYHLAAVYREAKHKDSEYQRVHVEGTRRLLEAAKAHRVRRFVHCSTVGVHGDVAEPPADELAPYGAGDIYQRTKLEGERVARSFAGDLEVAVARPTAIYGPGDTRLLKLFKMIAQRRFILLGRGDIFYHMVHIDDLVRGLRLLGTHPRAPGEVFILGGERYYTLKQITALIASAEGVPEPRLRLPARPFQLVGSLCEKICVPLGIEPPIHRRRVDFFTKSRAFSIRKARRVLGYRPQVGLWDGIRGTLSGYLASGQIPRVHRAGAVAMATMTAF